MPRCSTRAVPRRLAAVSTLMPLLAVALSAQQDDQARLVELRAAKRSEPVFALADWTFDYDEARARAKRSGKLIFGYFTRSYAACPPCASLERNALSDPAFAEFAERVVLFCHITSHVDGEPHPNLLAEKGSHSFPYLVFMTEDGEVLAQQPARARTVEAFGRTLAASTRYLELERRFEQGDHGVAAALLIARIEIGAIGFEAAEKARGELAEISGPERARLTELLLDLEVAELADTVRTRPRAIEVGARFAAMWREGRVPKGAIASSFFALVMEAAYGDGDAKLYERALVEYERVAPEGRNRQRVLQRLRKRLEELRVP
ncbi:MAG: thioredoxin family protein [Planctomycetes bacterium]|nr:thioredoxin family protein [Planctomycetota bacterium]